MSAIGFREVVAARSRSLTLIRHSFKPTTVGEGGWYHRLDEGGPGPTATAVALLAFHNSGESCDVESSALAFLKRTQHSDGGVLNEGGWAVTTSFGVPVLEATAWVACCLGSAGLGLDERAPIASLALRWLLVNRNDDGGWGSIRGHPSRVYHTCLAIQAIDALFPGAEALESASDWLLAAREPQSRAWGAMPNERPTVAHTSFALECLAEIGSHSTDALDGYAWLLANLDLREITDRSAYVESYNVDLGPRTLQGTIWHAPLARALGALVRHPEGRLPRAGMDAARAVLEAQGKGAVPGAWPTPGGVDGTSVWAVYPYLEALNGLLAVPAFATGRKVQALGPAGLVASSPEGAPLPVALIAGLLTGLLRRLKAKWAACVLVVISIAAVVLWAVGVLDFGIAIVGIVLPILLGVLDQARKRG